MTTYYNIRTTLTENGAVSLQTTGNARVDLFFKLVRNIPEETLEKLFFDSWNEDPLDTLKILFQSRDCRNGKGDRTPFLFGMQYIINNYPQWFLVNLKNISVYGRWLDYIQIYHMCRDDSSRKIKDAILNHLVETLRHDIVSHVDGKSVSLLAKWIPGEGKKWDKGILKELCVKLFNLKSANHVNTWHYYQLRKVYITPLRNAIKIVETHMCQNKWQLIDYSAVPSNAMTNYNSAFKKHDTERFLQYIEDVKNNKTKINAGVVYPHTLVEKYIHTSNTHINSNTILNEVYEAQWNVLESKINITDTVVVSDVSASMTGTPMMVSIALGILLASKNTSASFKNQVITFDDKPQFIDICDCNTLLEKIIKVKNMPWGGTTNLQKTFDIILAKCLLHSEDAPKKLIILSDMQFNEATYISSRYDIDTHTEEFVQKSICNFDAIRNKFHAHNLQMPEIIFWNLRGDTNDFPVSNSIPGVTLLSGFSPTLLNSITTGVEITAYDILRQILDSPHYVSITTP